MNYAKVMLIPLGLWFVSSSAMALDLPTYQLKLKKTDQPDASKVYRLAIETEQGQAVTPTAPLQDSLLKIAQKFAIPNVSTDSTSYRMTIEARPSAEFKLQFQWKMSKALGFQSCFQDWYAGLSNEQRFILLADLQDEGQPQGTPELRAHADKLASFVRDRFSSCAARYPSYQIGGEDGIYLYTGLDRWTKELRLEGLYANFKVLLDRSRDILESAYNNVSVPAADTNLLLKTWIEQVAPTGTEEKTFDFVESFASFEADMTPLRFALKLLGHSFSEEEILSLVASQTSLSAGVQSRMQWSDAMMTACFDKNAGNFRYSCNKTELEREKFVRLQYKSPLVEGSFSFLARKN